MEVIFVTNSLKTVWLCSTKACVEIAIIYTKKYDGLARKIGTTDFFPEVVIFFNKESIAFFLEANRFGEKFGVPSVSSKPQSQSLKMTLKALLRWEYGHRQHCFINI